MGLRAELPQGSTVEKRSKADQAKFKRMESSVAYPTSDAATGVTEKPGDLGEVAYPQTAPMYGEKSLPQPPQETKAPSEKPERSTYWDFSEWEKRQPGYGKPKRREPTWEEIGVGEGAAPGKDKTVFELLQGARKYETNNRSSDRFVGIDKDGKSIIERRPTDDGSNEPPPRPIGVPPEGTDIINTAMDIYRGSAENYPKDAPIDQQQGFAVAASTQDYINSGYNTEAPVAVQQINYGGRNGEVREYAEGERFFVSFNGNVIIRMRDRDSKSK